MATLKFFLQSTKDHSPIYIRLRDGKEIDLKAKTGLIINPSNWNNKNQRPKNTKSTELKKLIFELENIKVRILKAYNEIQLRKLPITSDWFKRAITGNPFEEKDPSLVSYFEKYISIKSEEVSERGIQKIIVLRDTIIEFEKIWKKKIEIVDVDLNFQNDFIKFLSSEKGYRQTTKHRTIKFLKTVCRHARTSGYESSPQLDLLGVKDGQVNIVYLTPEDIKKIKRVKLDFSYLDNARKWLLLSCYLGQRGGDLLNITSKQITEKSGSKVLDMRQQKTKKELYVLLTKEALDILEENDNEFPRKISLQNYNLYIKEVCKYAGINEITFGSKINPITKKKEDGHFEKWELVTTHIGRRSFATNYYGKVPTPLLMAQTGHTSEQMFLKYIGKGRTDQILALANAFKTI
ncbi:MAG: site-specific integrase [Cytophagales bacterium]|nr:site-specific integrase [Cytophagales bacterium]